TLFVGSYSGDYEILPDGSSSPITFTNVAATATKMSNTQFELAFSDPDVGTFTLDATVEDDGTDFEVAPIVLDGVTFDGDGFITPDDGFFKLNFDGDDGTFEQYFATKQ
ncbi:MAG: hypothetical protein AAF544_13350, partial [Bacteroidota bacterium]